MQINWDEFNPTEPWELPFDSTCIATASYNPFTQTLTIEFQQRGTYEYYGVPLTVSIGLIQSPSAGRYFNAVIRDNYSYSAI